MLLRGTFTALITPFKNDAIDYGALEAIIAKQIQGKVEGLVPAGTTGESPTLNHDEHRELIQRVVKFSKSIDKNVKIIAGTGSNSTKEAISLTQYAAKAGADYALSVNPYYNKPTQAGLVKHFKKIADESSIPIILYNIPGRTSVSLSLESIVELSNHRNIAGIKEATGDLNFMTQIILNSSKDFSLISGDDNLILPILAVGGQGVISVISNIFPFETGEITRYFFQGKFEKALSLFYKLFPLCKAMFSETNPIPVKYAAFLKGFCANELRLPLTSLTEANEIIVQEAIAQFERSI